MIVILMGVTGSGKTTVGCLLADELGWRFIEADDFHPEANLAKMRRGVPLTDEDRRPWLAALRAIVDRCLATGENAVLACSALKESYRRKLQAGHPGVALVYLRAGFELLDRRLAARRGHFMPRELLASQLATLEEPADALIVDAGASPAEIVANVRAGLSL